MMIYYIDKQPAAPYCSRVSMCGTWCGHVWWVKWQLKFWVQIIIDGGGFCFVYGFISMLVRFQKENQLGTHFLLRNYLLLFTRGWSSCQERMVEPWNENLYTHNKPISKVDFLCVLSASYSEIFYKPEVLMVIDMVLLGWARLNIPGFANPSSFSSEWVLGFCCPPYWLWCVDPGLLKP